MDKSEQINELAAALAKAQAKLTHVKKDKTARIRMKAGGEYSYNYADLGSTWDAGRAALTDNGLSVSQLPSFDNGWLMLDTILMHSSGQYISSQMRTRADEMDVKSIGSAITYLRRYAFAAIVGLVADEDDDGSAPQGNSRTAELTHTSAPASYAPRAPEPRKPAAEPQHDYVPAPATNGAPPLCPVHKKPMRKGNNGGYFCATKIGTDEQGKDMWCKARPEKPPAPTEPDTSEWDEIDNASSVQRRRGAVVEESLL